MKFSEEVQDDGLKFESMWCRTCHVRTLHNCLLLTPREGEFGNKPDKGIHIANRAEAEFTNNRLKGTFHIGENDDRV